MKTNFLRGFTAVLALLLTLLACHNVLLLKSEDGISQCRSLYKQKKDSIDVLFLGSSRIFCNVRTGILWDEYGIASYDLGGAETTMMSSFYHLSEALKTQHPEVVVLEVSVPVLRPTLFPPLFWVEDNTYGMKWNRNRIEATRIQTVEEEFKQAVIPLSTMHERYKELVEDDFIDRNNSIDYKGFDERVTVTPSAAPEASDVTERTPISEMSEEYLRRIIALCREKNTPLMFMVAPYCATIEKQGMFNYMADIAEENGVPYIDFNRYYEDFGMDYSCDMADEFHLNTTGSVKFSSYIGKILKDRYSLPDHRGDIKYASWDRDALQQRQQQNEDMLQKASTDGEYLSGLLNEQYLIYVSIGEDESVSRIFDKNREALNRIGVLPELMIPNENLILEGGRMLYASTDDEQKEFIDMGPENLLFTKTRVDDHPVTCLKINETSYEMNTDKMKILVFDKVLNRVVSTRDFDI